MMSGDLVERLNRASDWLIENDAIATALLVQKARDEIGRLNRIVEARNNECNRLSITNKELRGVIVAKNEALMVFADEESWDCNSQGFAEWGSDKTDSPMAFAREALEKD